MLKRPALVSPLAGWKCYPFTIEAYRDDSGLRLALQVEVGYSSTCPCSAALGTTLQTAVKRADEQAFALANGQNLMFCEDAARRLHAALLDEPAAAD